MNKEECFVLGYIHKLRGNNGELLIHLDVDKPSNYKTLESVFVELNDKLVPFFIEKISIGHKGEAIVKFEGIDTDTQAELLLNCSLYLPLTKLPKLTGKRFYFHEVIGFEVIDQKHGNIGTIKDIVEMTHYPILQVMNGEKEILIPAVDEIIVKVDRTNKKMEILAPEGLIEIYS